jgi:hypothetical protein
MKENCLLLWWLQPLPRPVSCFKVSLAAFLGDNKQNNYEKSVMVLLLLQVI